jgi:molybdopterin converting factor small subunit
MVKVQVWGSLRPAIGGAEEVEVEASSIKQLLETLSRNYTGMKEAIDRGVSVSVDGHIYATSLLVEIHPDSEVFIMPRLVGG